MNSSSEPRRPIRADRSTYERALDALESRARSVAELRRMLLRKGEPSAQVEAAIERLQSSGLLNDTEYARQLTRSKALGAGQSRRRIAQELGKKGVSRGVAHAAIADVFEEERVDESASLERVARKKMKSLSGLDAQTQRRRLYAFLARRGYDSQSISQVVERLAGVHDADV